MDGGDVLFKLPLPAASESERERDRQKALLIAKTLAALQPAAVNVGRSDLAAGADFLLQVGKETGLPWVSANLLGADGFRLFPAYRFAEWGGEKVAVIGLTSADPRRDRALGLQVANPVEAVRKTLAEIKGASLVLCVTDLGYEAEHALAREVPDIHLIVGGGQGARLLHTPIPVGDALLLRCADRGRQLGVLDLRAQGLAAWRKPADDTRVVEARAQLDAFRRQVEAGRTQNPPGAADPISGTFEALARQAASMGGAKAGYVGRIFQLAGDVPDDLAVAKEVAAYIAKYETTPAGAKGLPVQTLSGMPQGVAVSRPPPSSGKTPPPAGTVLPPTPGLGQYNAGTFSCRRCHVDVYSSWSQTAHAQSVSRLPPDQRGDRTCLECHGTRLEFPSQSSAEPFVGCETCHGKGSAHSGRGNIARQVGETVCRSCHKGFHSERKESFDYVRDYAQVRCDR